MRSSGYLLFALLIYLFGIATGGVLERQTSIPQFSPFPSSIATASAIIKTRDKATVTRIVDGDTITLSNGKTLRYIGVDTPESVDPRHPVECFAEEASQKNSELVLNKEIEMEKDISDIDRYGRLLRYVYVKEGEREVMVNELLVREGYAYARSYPPDTRHQQKLISVEHEAKQEKRGVWSNCH